jgi:hypothetical protein
MTTSTTIGRFVDAGLAPPVRPGISSRISELLLQPESPSALPSNLPDSRSHAWATDQQPALLIESRACNDDLPRL